MRRREFIAAIGGVVITWPHAVGAQQGAGTRYLRALGELKRDFAKISHPGEAARADYVTRLIRLREDAARAKTDAWQAIDTEIRAHPAPSDAEGKALASRLVGEWESPRHSYLYRADGTWTMTPVEPDITHGTWRIEGNQYFSTFATDPAQTTQYTIVLITKTDFVTMDDTHVFYETRLK